MADTINQNAFQAKQGPIGYGFFTDDIGSTVLRLGAYYDLKHTDGTFQLVEHVGSSNQVFMRHVCTGEVELVPYTQVIFSGSVCDKLYALGVDSQWFDAQMRYEAIYPILQLNTNKTLDYRVKQLQKINADYDDLEVSKAQLEDWLNRYQKNYRIYDLLDNGLTEQEKLKAFHSSFYWQFMASAWGRFELHRKGSEDDIVEFYGEDAEYGSLNEDDYLRLTLMYFVHLSEQPSHQNKLVGLLVDTFSHTFNRQLNFTIAYFTKHYAVDSRNEQLSFPVVSLVPMQFIDEMTPKHFYQMIAESMNFPYSTRWSSKKSLEYAIELVTGYQVNVIAANFDGLIACDPKQRHGFVMAVQNFMLETGVLFLIHGRKATLDFFTEYGNQDIFLPYLTKHH